MFRRRHKGPWPPSKDEEDILTRYRPIVVLAHIYEVVTGGIIRAGKTEYGAGTGFWLGQDPADDEYKFDIGTPTDYFRYDETNGVQIAADGSALTSIDGGEIQTGTILAASIAAGAITTAKLAANAVTAAKITAGTITATEIAADTITANEIAVATLTATELVANTITANKFNLALHFVDGTFTDDSPSAGSVAWAGCTVTYNGTTYTITNGNTDKAIIWWDKSLSTTTFQTTDTYPALDGTDDIIIGWNTSGTFMPLWQTRSVHGENIIAETITATEIAANAVTAAKINVSNLQALSVNTGALTVDDTLTMGEDGIITWMSGAAKITDDYFDMALTDSDRYAFRFLDGAAVHAYLAGYKSANFTQLSIEVIGPAEDKYGKFAVSAIEFIDADPETVDFIVRSDTGVYFGALNYAAGRRFKVDTMDAYFTNKVGINTDSPTAQLDVNSNIIRLRTAKTPASAGASGNQGDICWDASYLYICTATNTWERAAIDTW